MKKLILVLPMIITLASCATLSSSKAGNSAYDACLDRSEEQILTQYKDLGLTGATNVRHACEQIVEGK